MSRTRIARRALLATALLVPALGAAAPFTPGNLVIYRVGDGSAALSAAAAPVFLDEYTTTGTLVQSIAMPTADAIANQTLTAAGSSTSEGLMTLSTDGRYLVLAGYDAAPGTAAVAGTTSVAVNRVVGRVDASGTTDSSTRLDAAYSGSNIRSVASVDGLQFWLGGTASPVSTGGVWQVALGSTGAATQISTTVTNTRQVAIFESQLYVGAQSGAIRVATVGTGLPSTAGQAMSNLPNYPNATSSPYQYFFADLDTGVTGIDTLYVANDDGAAFAKYSLVGGNWTSNGLIGVDANDFRGLTAVVNGTTVTLYAVRNANTLVGLVDASGYNGAFAGAPGTLASAPTNTAFRGVAFTPSGGPVGPSLSVGNVSTAEGNTGTTTFSFTVSLSAPAGAGGVGFDIATADGTATLADNDYVQRSLTGQVIAAAGSSYTFDVAVNGDLANEPNETFFVNVTNVTGATVSDGQGQGTINNDDTPLTPIHAIQGSGAASPLLGNAVVTRGVVTVRVNNGFYFQTPDADTDADPNTSQGLFAFTSSAPPASVVVGNLVQVAGTVAEFVPPTDPNQQPLTQLTAPTVTVVATGLPLPTPVALTNTLPAPAGGIEQLERLENMRVAATSFTITGATGGSISEPNATSTTNGRFYGVVAGNPRPFREPGLEPEDAVGRPATIPRWDGNPERINFESLRARNGAGTQRTAIDVDAGQTVSGLSGVIDYAFRNWRFTIEFDAIAVVGGSATAGAVSTATPAEYTVASYNLQRFFDDTDAPGLGEPVLTPVAFANRLAKASRGIREFLRTPDILGIVEIEDLVTLQALADRINADAIAASEPNPQYQAFLSNGTDPGGIDVGFLVKSAPVGGSTPRVAVNSVTQFGLTTLLKCPDGSDNATGERLNDRPPLLLDAVVAAPNGATAPVVVIVNHSRSLGSVTSTAPPPAGPCPVVNFASEGDRVRRKRQQQAEFLANLVQARQLASPNENLVVVGDFNAFEFNDGLGDSIGVISGTPAPDNETVVPGDGIDLVTPNLGNLITGVAATQRYSYVFDGDAQNLDHALANAPITASAAPVRLEHARINADFAEDNRGDTTVPLRLSDHDPAVAYFSPPGFGLPDALFASGFEEPLPP